MPVTRASNPLDTVVRAKVGKYRLSAFDLPPFLSSDAMEFRRSDCKFDWSIDGLILGRIPQGSLAQTMAEWPTAWLSYFPSL